MHIAVCDDNMADRKQFERLLKRESDKRAQDSGILFANSFGNADALLKNPMQYDAFYIDICHTPGVSGLDVAAALLEKGINKPIVLCCSLINYREHSFPDNVFFLDKPIKTQELSHSITLALQIKNAAEPLIELRTTTDTLYVREEDIVYGIEEGPHVGLHLTDGRIIYVADTAINFFKQIESFPSFMAPTLKSILNCRYITNLKFRKAIMPDGKRLKIQKECMNYAKVRFSEYHS